MMRTTLTLTSIIALAACGGGSSDDAPDDTDAPTSSATPAAGVYRTTTIVTITADEPATIYYTTDGSAPSTSSESGASPLDVEVTGSATVRFFAVDVSGNAESPDHSLALTIDRLGPTAVDGLVATVVGDDVELTWTNPGDAGFARVVIVETDDVAATMPTDGDDLAVDDAVGAGRVVFAGSGQSFTHAGAGVGSHTYAAWAQFDTGTFSEGRTAAAFVDAAQTGQLTLDVAAASITAGTQPANVALSGANVAFDGTTGVATFDLSITSGFAGRVFNPKIAITALSSGTFDNADGTLDGDGYRYYGPNALGAGAVTRTVEIGGLTATSVVTIDLAFRHDVGYYGSTWRPDELSTTLVDLGTGAATLALPEPPGFDNPNRPDDYAQLRGAVVSADGRYLFAGTRNTNQVLKYDLVAGAVVGATSLSITRTVGSTSHIELDPSGRRIYAILNDGVHTANSSETLEQISARINRPLEDNDVFLVEIDAASMNEVGRVPLGGGNALYVGRRFGLSRDGRSAAIPIGGPRAIPSISVVRIVDVSAWRETTDAEGIDATPARPPAAAFDWTGRHVVVCETRGNANWDRVGVIDLEAATPALTFHDIDGSDTTAAGKINGFVARPDGTFWLFGELAGAITFDPATGSFDTTGTASREDVAAGLRDGELITAGHGGVFRVDTTTGEVTSLGVIPAATENYGHTLAMTPF